jgi:hypothetical protein
MDSNFALYKHFVRVGSLGTGGPPIIDGAQFNSAPHPVGMGNRCRLLFYTLTGTPFATMTSLELYLEWYGDAQRFVTGGGTSSFGPNANTRFDALESMDAAGATPDQRIHDMKYSSYKLPLTAPSS